VPCRCNCLQRPLPAFLRRRRRLQRSWPSRHRGPFRRCQPVNVSIPRKDRHSLPRLPCDCAVGSRANQALPWLLSPAMAAREHEAWSSTWRHSSMHTYLDPPAPCLAAQALPLPCFFCSTGHGLCECPPWGDTERLGDVSQRYVCTRSLPSRGGAKWPVLTRAVPCCCLRGRANTATVNHCKDLLCSAKSIRLQDLCMPALLHVAARVPAVVAQPTFSRRCPAHDSVKPRRCTVSCPRCNDRHSLCDRAVGSRGKSSSPSATTGVANEALSSMRKYAR